MKVAGQTILVWGEENIDDVAFFPTLSRLGRTDGPIESIDRSMGTYWVILIGGKLSKIDIQISGLRFDLLSKFVKCHRLTDIKLFDGERFCLGCAWLVGKSKDVWTMHGGFVLCGNR